MIHLRGRTADVVLDTSTGVPTIVHWGAPLGDVDPTSLLRALERPIAHGMLDVVAPVSIVPEHGSGFQGRPGLAGHRRGGTAWSARFAPAGITEIDHGVVVSAIDEVAALRLDTRVVLDHALVVQCTLTNLADSRYLLDQLAITLPLPVHADDLLTFIGRWTRELHPVRREWGSGAVLIENRRGRTSHEHVPLVFAGSHGFGEWQGEVWGAHLAWSGNHGALAEVLPDGRRYVQLGELLHPGELSLGQGDQYVTPEVVATYASDGLMPLIEHVRGLGMEFGIWVEPEMVNPDSDVYRAHPEWALVTDGYEPVLGRHQLVLDLAQPGAYAHVFGQLDALLRDHDIAYVKWDMNRDHVQGSGSRGTAGTHAQTLAVYRLLDELRAQHPDVEIESCASGGARIDHGILARTDRVWTSDCNDALERQTIQRGASLFVTPELMGAHIGPPRSHTTGRVHSLSFRAITALFGHLGVEWNVLTLDDRERDQLRDWIALHQRFRPLLHAGDVVRFDPVLNGTTPSSHAHGVYAADRSEALVAIVQLQTGMSLTPPVLRLPGLDPDRRYRVELVGEAGIGRLGPSRVQPAWIRDGIELTGRQLAVHGIQPPALHPETAVLVHLRAR